MIADWIRWWLLDDAVDKKYDWTIPIVAFNDGFKTLLSSRIQICNLTLNLSSIFITFEAN